MTEKRFRHLPVTEGGRLVGVISIGDAVRTVVEEQESTSSSSRTTSRAARVERGA
jgi:CBS domain-containing protein